MKRLFRTALLTLFLFQGTIERLPAALHFQVQASVPEVVHDVLKKCAEHYSITAQQAFTEYDKGTITIEKIAPQYYLVQRNSGDPIVILIDSL